MIDKFLLIDECDCDNDFMNLIVFDKPVSKKDLYNAINKVKNDDPLHYTNEDIYEAIDTLNISYDIISLINIEKIYY